MIYHILIIHALISLPDGNYVTRFGIRWQRWTKDYLQTLSLWNKWKKGNHIIKTGQQDLVKDSAIHPSQWKLARFDQIHPGADGVLDW